MASASRSSACIRAPLSLLYVTCPSTAVANRIAKQAIDQGHAACANILPGMRSIYRWRGRIESAREVVLLLKTSRRQLPLLMAAVRESHPYDTPCLIELPVGRSDRRYAQWLGQQMESGG
jgi:periplasmic divalent cation tolerance protein